MSNPQRFFSTRHGTVVTSSIRPPSQHRRMLTPTPAYIATNATRSPTRKRFHQCKQGIRFSKPNPKNISGLQPSLSSRLMYLMMDKRVGAREDWQGFSIIQSPKCQALVRLTRFLYVAPDWQGNSTETKISGAKLSAYMGTSINQVRWGLAAKDISPRGRFNQWLGSQIGPLCCSSVFCSGSAQ